MKQLVNFSYCALAVALTVFAQSSLPAFEDGKGISASTPVRQDLEQKKELYRRIAELIDRAHSLQSRRYFAAARPLYEEAVELSRKSFGDSHFQTRLALTELEFHDWRASLSEEDFVQFTRVSRQMASGGQLVRQCRYTEAAEALNAATAEIEKLKLPLVMRYTAYFQIERVMALVSCGKVKEASVVAELAKKLVNETAGEESPYAARLLRRNAMVQRRLGNDHEVLRCCAKACRIVEQTEGMDSPTYSEPIGHTLDSLIDLEEFAQARERLNKVKTLVNSSPAVGVAERLEVLMIEIRLLVAERKNDEAIKKISEAETSPNRPSDETFLLNGIISMRAGDIKSAGPLIRGACATALPVRDISEYIRLPYHNAYAELLIKEGSDAEAKQYLAGVLECVEAEGAKDIALRQTLGLYAQALSNLGQINEANQAEIKRANMCATVEEMRRRIQNDPECKLSWEE